MFRVILIIALMAMTSFGFSGCKKSTDEEEVKTAAEYKAEAKEQINEDNMAAELERLEKELEQDVSQEQ